MTRPSRRDRMFGGSVRSKDALALKHHQAAQHTIHGFRIGDALRIAKSGHADPGRLAKAHEALVRWAADTGTSIADRSEITEVLEQALRHGTLGADARDAMETMPRTFAALLADFPRTEAADEARA